MKWLLCLGCLGFLTLAAQTPPYSHNPLSIGEKITFPSAILQEERTLNVYLPPAYHPDSLYSLIYLLDGSTDEDFIHLAGLSQFLSFPWIAALPPSIVVGIANTDRRRDFTTPSANAEDQLDFPQAGGSAHFIRFLAEEVIPIINSRYPCDSISTLIGQSLGGLLATEIVYHHPQLFHHYVIVSPSLWWDNESLLMEDLTEPWSGRVYIAVGNEGAEMERLASELHQKMLASPAGEDQLKFEYYAEHDHGDIMHLAVYYGLRWIFSP